MAKVEYIDHMGDDNAVVDAARVSFDKTHDNYSAASNERLIRYLRNHGHWSPFSHCIAQFRITAPIFVARQLFKHQVGLSINEISRRYVDYDPTFDPPTVWRGRHRDKKQGSSHTLPTSTQNVANKLVNEALEVAETAYKSLLELNIAPEQARIILPLCTDTSWIWTGTLEAWLRICGLRLAKDAQTETQIIATQIAEWIEHLFPLSWKYFNENLQKDL